ncbi:hypothetical protein FCV25MIE_17341, partial [Fagus crenata]
MGRASPSVGLCNKAVEWCDSRWACEEVERVGRAADLVTGLRNEAVERHGGTSFADLVTGLRDEAVERAQWDSRLSRTGLRW